MKRDSRGTIDGGGKEGRKEGRKVTAVARASNEGARGGEGNPAGFNHRPPRRGSSAGSPSAPQTIPLARTRCRSSSPPQEDERGRERERERRDAGGMREGATAGAMRIGLISNSQTRRNRYISRRHLSIGGPRLAPDTPRYLSRRG